MNTNSILCKFISDHPNDWEEILENEYDLRIKKDGNYAIFNYSILGNFYDPIVQEARGIILDYVNLEVVCWPFRKFGNHTEGYVDTIDWKSARVLEKVDGSIVKLWYDRAARKWQFSTNGMIRAEEARADEISSQSYMDVIRSADNFCNIPFEELDKDTTYIFELVSPQTRVVIKYDTASLYHLGTRNNITGMESETDIGIKKPKSYSLGSIDDCINASAELNRNESGMQAEEITAEGFVVVDKDWHRIKIKSPDYIINHHLSSVKSISKFDCVHLLINASSDINTMCDRCEELIPIFKYYDFKLSELYVLADKMAIIARQFYEEYSHERKAVANIIVKHRLSGIGFKALDTELKGREILLGLPTEKICKLIPDYQPEDLSDLIKSHNTAKEKKN
ncbi:MAG: hypothetical protein IKB34_07625 [Clostridia bacterium]|nr:hypothetical protein [Clostridia bacterium]